MSDGRSSDIVFRSVAPDANNMLHIMAGLSDGIMLMGERQEILWANDAALSMHGVETLRALGGTVEQYQCRYQLRYRNNHEVEPNRYPLARLAQGETFGDICVEVTIASARDEDAGPRWVHVARGLVLADSGGTPRYRVLIIKDETERFDAEQRFEAAFNTNPAPAVICRLSDMRYVRVNPGFLEVTGYMQEHVLDRTFRQIDLLADAEQQGLALDRLQEGHAIPQMESSIRLPDGVAKAVIIAGQPITVKDDACMLFTFVDLDPHKQTESALRQSEERFSKSFRLSPVATVICRLESFEIVEVNDAFKILSGYLDKELVGHSIANLDLWGDSLTRRTFEQEVSRNGGIRDLDFQLKAKDGAIMDCLMSADQVSINNEPHVLCVMQDITDRKRTEEELVAAIEAVMADTSWFSRGVVEKLTALRHSGRPRAVGADLDDLTRREQEVLGLVCEGLSDAEMSLELNLSRNTIRNHVFSLYQKIDVNSRGAAIIWGRERGITSRAAVRLRKPSR